MCTPESIVELFLICALVGFIGASYVLAWRFRAHLKEHHPGTWRWLGEWKIRWPDGDVQDAALPEYLWSGQYMSLNDPLLNRLAMRAKLTSAFSIAIVLALMLHSILYPSSQPFGCFHV